MDEKNGVLGLPSRLAIFVVFNLENLVKGREKNQFFITHYVYMHAIPDTMRFQPGLRPTSVHTVKLLLPRGPKQKSMVVLLCMEGTLHTIGIMSRCQMHAPLHSSSPEGKTLQIQ